MKRYEQRLHLKKLGRYNSIIDHVQKNDIAAAIHRIILNNYCTMRSYGAFGMCRSVNKPGTLSREYE